MLTNKFTLQIAMEGNQNVLAQVHVDVFPKQNEGSAKSTCSGSTLLTNKFTPYITMEGDQNVSAQVHVGAFPKQMEGRLIIMQKDVDQ